MGYSTDFYGTLKFTEDLTGSQLAYLKTFFGEDPGDHPEWIKPDSNYGYLQYELTKDFSGIEWDGSEKFYYAVEACNLIIANMKAKYPLFGLTGSLEARGEEVGDVWTLAIIDGKAKHVDRLNVGDTVTCPHCQEKFLLEVTE